VIFLKLNDLEKAQKAKEQIEIFQRQDEKLRKQFKKHAVSNLNEEDDESDE